MNSTVRTIILCSSVTGLCAEHPRKKPAKKSKLAGSKRLGWRARRDLNPQPSDPKFPATHICIDSQRQFPSTVSF
jgi:hypothetical protein